METLKTNDVRQRLGDLLDRVDGRNDRFVIERRGRPLAAIVPFETYRQMQEAAAVELLTVLDRTGAKTTSTDAGEIALNAKRKLRGY